MTELVTYIDPAELKTIRLECSNCRFVAELPIQKSENLLSNSACKNCNTDLVSDAQRESIKWLGRAIGLLSEPDKRFSIELVTNDPKKETGR